MVVSGLAFTYLRYGDWLFAAIGLIVLCAVGWAVYQVLHKAKLAIASPAEGFDSLASAVTELAADLAPETLLTPARAAIASVKQDMADSQIADGIKGLVAAAREKTVK